MSRKEGSCQGEDWREALILTHPCLQSYVPTVFENYTASFEIDKRRIELNMWDTSGSPVPRGHPDCQGPLLYSPSLSYSLRFQASSDIHPILEHQFLF